MSNIKRKEQFKTRPEEKIWGEERTKKGLAKSLAKRRLGGASASRKEDLERGAACPERGCVPRGKKRFRVFASAKVRDGSQPAWGGEGGKLVKSADGIKESHRRRELGKEIIAARMEPVELAYKIRLRKKKKSVYPGKREKI